MFLTHLDPAGPKDYELLLFFADRRSKEFAKEAKRGKPRLIDVLGRNKGPTIWKKKKTRREKTRKKLQAKTKARRSEFEEDRLIVLFLGISFGKGRKCKFHKSVQPTGRSKEVNKDSNLFIDSLFVHLVP